MASILFIRCCCFVYKHFGSSQEQHLKWDGNPEEEERVEIPDIGGHTSVNRGGLNREPVGDYTLPSRETQYPQVQWDGRALASFRDAESSRQQYNNTRNVILGELGHSGGQGSEYRGKSTGDNNLPSREAHRQQWDGRSWVESRDSQKQYINTGNVREERLKAPVTSTPVVIELEKARSSQGGCRGGFTRTPTGDNNDSNQEELSQQERREDKLKDPVPSAPAVLELKKPRSLPGGQTCCVCMTQTIEIIFNCAHAATCEECAQSLSVCPICRADITSRNRIYLSGI